MLETIATLNGASSSGQLAQKRVRQDRSPETWPSLLLGLHLQAPSAAYQRQPLLDDAPIGSVTAAVFGPHPVASGAPRRPADAARAFS
jgi:hypothetical protein